MLRRRTSAAPPQMNITPLIDVVFQLIIFFLLVNNILAEQSVQMIVPELTRSTARALTEGKRVVVNVAPYEFAPSDRAADPLDFPGEAQFVRVGQKTFAMSDLASVTEELRSWKRERADVEVLLRADAALHYEDIAPVMAAITAARIDTVNLVASMPEDR